MTDDGDAAGADGDRRRDPAPETYSTQRYLAAKRTVDDRALNGAVLDRLRDAVDPSPAVLEVGAGIGTMVARVLRRNLLAGAVSYTAVDLDADSVATARERLPEWGRAAGYEVSRPAGGPATPDLVFESGPGDPDRLSLWLRVADAAAVAGAVGPGSGDGAPATGGHGEDRAGSGESPPADRVTVDPATDDSFTAPAAGYDLLVGAAFLDLVDWPTAETLVGAVRPGGHCYFPITFDGRTTFAPAPDRTFERRLERAFHAHLDADTGTSRAGRRAVDRLPETDVEVLAAAGSDWTVRPADSQAGSGASENGAGDADADGHGIGGAHYPADEAYFLHHVLDLVYGALSPEGGAAEAGAGDSEGAESDAALDSARLAAWVRTRHEQVAAGELTYITHQLDVLGRRRA